MSNVTAVFFSPSETTKKVVSQIANNFNDENVVCDLLYFNDEKKFESDDIIVDQEIDSKEGLFGRN